MTIIDCILRKSISLGSVYARLNCRSLSFSERHVARYTHMQIREGGSWSDSEMEKLLKLWRRGLRRSTVAKYLGRSNASVTSKLIKLQGLAKLDADPSPCVKIFDFKECALGILDALAHDNITASWKEFLDQKQRETWYELIEGSMPPEVRTVFASPTPPSFDQMKALPTVDTNNRGVYAWILEPRFSIGPTVKRRRYLYIGSASRQGFGLIHRTTEHQPKSPWIHNRRLWDLSVRHRLRRDCFVKLLDIPSEDSSAKEKLETRYLIVLAEAMFTVWLGALQKTRSEYLHKYCPWGTSNLAYEGACSHNPLLLDFEEVSTLD